MSRVETASGAVEGAREGGLDVYRGIPYAQPPIGELRFRAPRPPRPWSGVRPATEFGPWAPQNAAGSALTGETPAAGDEDCLTLNVWTPGSDGSRRPVMVWIHGGGFTGGSGAAALYGGARLARRGDLVVVTINYRLGILGFLAHPGLTDEEAGGASGNWGLLDQVAALRWVRDNISAFGGDPGNVTIFGESAGGMSVTDLLAMPSARGLFGRAIAQSGPPSGVSMARAEEHTSKLLAEFGFTEPAQLRTLPVDALLAAQGTVLTSRAGGGLILVPVIDGESVPIAPLQALTDGSAARVPFMVGTNRDEAKLFMVGDPKNRDPDDDLVLRRIDRGLAFDGIQLSPVGLLDAYRNARAERGDPTDPRELWSAIESDRMFRIGSLRAASAHARWQPETYCYLFTWESPAMGGALGACHAVEIPFALGNLEVPGMDRFAGSGPEACALSQQMMDAWIGFARSGNPSHDGIPTWPTYDEATRSTMVFGRATHLEDAPMEPERALWDLVEV
jgi:para-nitrobenzyl esterase